MNPKFAVIFDMDGVLVDNSDYHLMAWNHFLEIHHLTLNDDIRRKVFGTTNKEHLQFFFKRKLTKNEIINFEKQKEAIYREIYHKAIKPVKGLQSFLHMLKSNKIPVVLATSAPAINVDFVLSRIQLKDYFPKIVDASMVKKGKPDPEIYLKAAALVNIDPTQCIVIEDSMNGILSAKNAGTKVIAITTTHKMEELPEVDLIIRDFNDLSLHKIENLLLL